MRGARLNVKYLRPGMGKNYKCNKCPVCGKALRRYNKIGLCSQHYSKEIVLNKAKQITIKK